jgi:hypothetical protein
MWRSLPRAQIQDAHLHESIREGMKKHGYKLAIEIVKFFWIPGF